MTKPATPPQMPRLGDFLCFAVYSANLAYGRAYKPILDELGLTYTQWITIVALWEHDEQTVSSLGDKLFLESNTLTPILKKLEALGYLERRRSEEHTSVPRVEHAHAHPEEAGGAGLPGAPAIGRAHVCSSSRTRSRPS